MDSKKTMTTSPAAEGVNGKKQKAMPANMDAMARVFVENQSHVIHEVNAGMDADKTVTETTEGDKT